MNKFGAEMSKYSKNMKTFLPLEEIMISLKRKGLTIDEVKHSMGEDSKIIEYVPEVLYHGSTKSLDAINPNESTQSGKTVYATDNPMHALFFAIFRNSSQVRAHIREHINSNGEYEVKYKLDERYEGALNETITDNTVTIHVCNGSDFFKPLGEQYIGREWISKEGKTIIPTDKIIVSPKKIFQELNKKGLLQINPYNNSKDLETVIDMVSLNYPYGLTTENAINNLEAFEKSYDDYIMKHFPNLFDFSKKFREYAKEVMFSKEILDIKLKTIRNKGKFLLSNNEFNIEKINNSLYEEEVSHREM